MLQKVSWKAGVLSKPGNTSSFSPSTVCKVLTRDREQLLSSVSCFSVLSKQSQHCEGALLATLVCCAQKSPDQTRVLSWERGFYIPAQHVALQRARSNRGRNWGKTTSARQGPGKSPEWQHVVEEQGRDQSIQWKWQRSPGLVSVVWVSSPSGAQWSMWRSMEFCLRLRRKQQSL